MVGDFFQILFSQYLNFSMDIDDIKKIDIKMSLQGKQTAIFKAQLNFS